MNRVRGRRRPGRLSRPRTRRPPLPPRPDVPSRPLQFFGRLAALLWAGLMVGLSSPAPGFAATFDPADMTIVHSHSGLFVVVAPKHLRVPSPPPVRADAPPGTPPPPAVLHLTPEFAAVSCERIKEALSRTFGLREVFPRADSRRPVRIHVTLADPATTPAHLIFEATRYLDGWRYRLQAPAAVAPEAFVRGVVHALLQSWANHYPGPHAAEIPAWLTEGLTRHLEFTSPVELVLDRPSASGNQLPLEVSVREKPRGDPLEPVRARLRLQPALGFTALSLPEPAMDLGALEHYRDSAHIFTAELFKSREARAGVRRMLELLPQYLNWQTAFFRAFRPTFERPIDVEKWWALRLVSFTGRDPRQTWTEEIAHRKLEDVLLVRAELRQGSRDLPQQGLVPMQRVVSEWDRVPQRIALQRAVQQLAAIQLKLPPDLARLAEAYRVTLNDYLALRGRGGHASDRKGDVPLTAAMLAVQTVRQLDELDRQRLESQGPAPSPTP